MASDTSSAAGVLITFRETPRAVKALIVGMLINRLGSFLQVFLILFLTSRGYDTSRAGLALAAHGAGGIAGGLGGGWLTDRLGSRLTIVVSAIATAVGTVLFYYAPSYPSIIACGVLVGALSQAYRPASSAMLAQMTPRARYTMVFAMYRLATNLGTTIGPVLGAALIKLSYATLFWVEAIVLAAYAAAAYVILPSSPAADAEHAPTQQGAGSAGSAGLILRDVRFMAFLTATMLVSVVYIQHLVSLPLQVHARGLPTEVYGGLLAVNGLIVTAFELPATSFTQHWPPRLAFMANIALIGAGMALYAAPWGIPGMVLATAVWSAGELIGAPTMFAYPAMVAPPAQRGRYLGASSVAIGVAFAAGPAIGALVWAAAGARVWLLCSLVSLAALVAAYIGVLPGDRVLGAADQQSGAEPTAGREEGGSR